MRQRDGEQERREAFAAEERRANPTRPLLALSADDVLAWSSTLGLPAEISTGLAAKGVDGMGLARLTKEQLREEGMLTDGKKMKLGQVHKLLQAIQSLAASGWSPVLAEDDDAGGAGGAAATGGSSTGEDQQSALLEEIAGAEGAGTVGSSDFGQHLSSWASDVPAPPAADPPPVVDADAAEEADAARSARLSQLTSEPEPEPVPLKPKPNGKPAGKDKWSIDYSRFGAF